MNRPGRGGLPFGFLGALALVLAVEQAIVHQKIGAMGGNHWCYEGARRKADSGDRSIEVLCFGDSLLKQGLAPPVIESKAGIKAYNFAIAGGQAPGNYFLLKRALESGIRPKALLVEYFPKLMSKDPDFNIENWPFLASPLESLELAKLCRSPSLLAELTLRAMLPSVRCRNSIRANIQFALSGSFFNFASEIRSARRNWEVNRGAEIVASRPELVSDLDAWMRGYFPKFECTRANRAYIKKFLDLASRNEIPVFWVLPPYKPELQARVEQSGFDKVHESFIRTLQARYPGLYVIDGRHSGYDPRVFFDPHHLGRDGASIFSEDVGSLLRRHRDDPGSTSRWQKLADYRAIATTHPIEDMNESRRKVLEVATGGVNSTTR